MSVPSYSFHSLLLKLSNKGMDFPFTPLKLPNKGMEEYSKMILFIPFHFIPFPSPKRDLSCLDLFTSSWPFRTKRLNMIGECDHSNMHHVTENGIWYINLHFYKWFGRHTFNNTKWFASIFGLFSWFQFSLKHAYDIHISLQ